MFWVMNDSKDQDPAAERGDPEGLLQNRTGNLWQCFHRLAVDTNTVDKHVELTDNNKTMLGVSEDQNYPDHPDRFDYWDQVLCRDGLTGLRYWEVDWRGPVSIAVSYRGIQRKGSSEECKFGFNDQSWCLACHQDHYTVIHDKKEEEIRSVPVSCKIGVLLNHAAGTLSFFALFPNDMIHIYTFKTTFTEPVYAGFTIWGGSSVSL